VESASAFGITQAEIATQLKISEPTLRKHFRDELSSGKFKVDMTAGKTVAELMKSREQVGKDGGPIETKDVSAIDVIGARIASATARLGSKERPGYRLGSRRTALADQAAFPRTGRQPGSESFRTSSAIWSTECNHKR
jgi:hypothetical protein